MKNKLNKEDFKMDEYYGKWYVCPFCNEREIIEGNKYCPSCGSKLK